MLVNVRLFASYREAAGVGHLQLELKPGAKVRDAIAEVVKAHPLIAEGRQVVIARNRDYVDVAVVIAVAAPHRDAAFAAARAAIDELKTVVPIWKKEHAEDGAVWIEEHA